MASSSPDKSPPGERAAARRRRPDRLRRLLSLKSEQRRDLAVAVVELFRARIRLAVVPTERLLGQLRSAGSAPQAASETPAGGKRLESIAWAIAAAGRRVPWRADCLVQAIAADRWLKRIGLVPEFSLGVMKTEDGVLRAHALIRCNNVTVTGDGLDGFSVLIGPSARERASARP